MEAHRPTWPSLLLVSLFLFPVLFPAMASAEHSLEAGKKALSFALPSGGGALVGGTYFLSQREAVHVDFGYSVTIPDGGDKIGGFSIVPAYIKYLSVGRMATFVKKEPEDGIDDLTLGWAVLTSQLSGAEVFAQRHTKEPRGSPASTDRSQVT